MRVKYLKSVWRVIGYAVIIAVTFYIVKFGVDNYEILFEVAKNADSVKLALHFMLVGTYFLIVPVIWGQVVNAYNISSNRKTIILSAYLPSLGKYIPGKIWSVVGRAMILKKMAPTNIASATLATITQYCYEIAGACLYVGLYCWANPGGSNEVFSVMALGLLIIPVLSLYPKPFLKHGWGLVKRIFYKLELDDCVPNLNPRLILLVSAQWGIYALSGIFLVWALMDLEFSKAISVGAVFVISWLLGFLSLLTPGGIGVREGVCISLLTPLIGIDIATLATITSRITWSVFDGFTIIYALSITDQKQSFFDIIKENDAG